MDLLQNTRSENEQRGTHANLSTERKLFALAKLHFSKIWPRSMEVKNLLKQGIKRLKHRQLWSSVFPEFWSAAHHGTISLFRSLYFWITNWCYSRRTHWITLNMSCSITSEFSFLWMHSSALVLRTALPSGRYAVSQKITHSYVSDCTSFR